MDRQVIIKESLYQGMRVVLEDSQTFFATAQPSSLPESFEASAQGHEGRVGARANRRTGSNTPLQLVPHQLLTQA